MNADILNDLAARVEAGGKRAAAEANAREDVREHLIGKPMWQAAMWLTKRSGGASYFSIAKEMGLYD